MRASEPYVRRFLGEGFLVKQELRREDATSLGPVYKTRLVPSLMLYFGRRDGRLQIVPILFDD